MLLTSVGSMRAESTPATSGIDDVLLVITGVPHAIASSSGMPKLSRSDVYRNANAALYIDTRSLLSTYPAGTIYSRAYSILLRLRISLMMSLLQSAMSSSRFTDDNLRYLAKARMVRSEFFFGSVLPRKKKNPLLRIYLP